MEAGAAPSQGFEREETSPANVKVRPYKHEDALFAISLIVSLGFWFSLFLLTLGTVVFWILALFIGYLFAHSAFIAYIKGTGVRLGPEQSPELYARVRECAAGLGIPAPEAYLLNGEGLLNALATRFLGRNFIVLYSDVVDALESRPQALNFYIGHELGHIKRKHLSWGPVLWPANLMPLIGPAYSRAREYTCDAYGQACCETPTDAAVGLAVLAAGPSRWSKVDVQAYAGQSAETGGFWMSFHELVGDYPWLVKRMEHVKARATRSAPAIPGRNPMAWVVAFFVPRVGVGGSAAGMMVVVAIAGILAAIAIPAYQEYITKAQASAAFMDAEPVTEQVGAYVISNGALPENLSDAGVRADYASRNIRSVRLTDNGIEFTLEGSNVGGETIVYSPYVENEQLHWDCTGVSLKLSLRPGHCRQ